MPTYAQQKASFIKTLDGLTGKRRAFPIFQDWTELAAIALHQLPYQSQQRPIDQEFERLETRFLKLENTYTPEERQAFGHMLGMVMVASQLQQDFLGDIYQEMGFANEKTGQFFTPFALNRAMAQLSMTNIEACLQEKPVITIADPACGSGGSLIAAAVTVAEQGYDPRAVVQLYGTDVDRTCFNMTYIQLAAMGMQAQVIHGNSLSRDVWETRDTPQLQFYRDWLKTKQAEDKAAQMVEMIKALVTDPDQEPDIETIVEEALAIESADQPTIEVPEPDILLEKPRQLGLFDEYTAEP